MLHVTTGSKNNIIYSLQCQICRVKDAKKETFLANATFTKHPTSNLKSTDLAQFIDPGNFTQQGRGNTAKNDNGQSSTGDRVYQFIQCAINRTITMLGIKDTPMVDLQINDLWHFFSYNCELKFSRILF